MGHVRVPRLPRGGKWDQVVRLLGENPRDVARVSAAIIAASERRLRELHDDPSLSYSFWLLSHLAAASHGSSFELAVQATGMDVIGGEPLLSFLSAVGDRVREETGAADSGHFREMAIQALRRTLIDAVGTQGPGLFDSRIDELREGFRLHAGADQFGRLAERFFGEFTARVLANAVERELSQQVGADRKLQTTEASAEVAARVQQYGRRSGAIVREFTRDWYALRNWQLRQSITRDDAQRFVGVALGSYLRN